MPPPPVLVLRAVSKAYRAGLPGCSAAVLVLESADLVVRAGERVAIVGPRGSGKTTLLLLAAGLLRPDRGDVWRRSGAVSERAPGSPPDRLVWHHPGARGTLLVEVPAGRPPPPWVGRVVRVGGGGVAEVGSEPGLRRASAR